MDKLRRAAEQMLEELEIYFDAYPHMQKGYVIDAITDLRTALAEQPAEQEPVAWMTHESKNRLRNGGNSKGSVPVHKNPSHTSCIPLYTAPQPRRRLSDAEIEEINVSLNGRRDLARMFARAIEKAVWGDKA